MPSDNSHGEKPLTTASAAGSSHRRSEVEKQRAELVGQLRVAAQAGHEGDYWPFPVDALRKAADLIEQQAGEVVGAKKWARFMEIERDHVRAENARLTSLLETWDQNNIEYEKLYRAALAEIEGQRQQLDRSGLLMGAFEQQIRNARLCLDSCTCVCGHVAKARNALGEG